jgi:alpha-tubulin suppressor-like RCC1 family protein
MKKSILAAVAAGLTVSLFGCAARDDEPAQSQALDEREETDARTAQPSFGPLALGSSHTCTLARRGVRCWGSAASGLQTPPALSHPRQITAGGTHVCVLDDTGVKCWGSNSSGQTAVPTTLRNPTQVVGGNSHTCALDADGVKCWGSNISQQITVPTTLRSPRVISAGSSHSCAIDADGVKCWGSNTSQQLTVPTTLRNPKQISLGTSHSCALDADGVKCWGSNTSQQTTVPPLRNPRQITAGGTHNCALDDDGVKCWGSNTSGQTMVPPLRRPTQISAGRTHTCAFDDDDTVVCWGSNLSQQITVPADLELSGQHACMVANGALRCTGDNERGQLGLGNDADQAVALGTAAATDLGQTFGVPTQTAVGHSFGCALNGSGAVKCWGVNRSGQLGLGDSRDRGLAASDMGNALPALQFPAAAGALKKVDVGDDHACAFNAAGALFCWGKGSSGQLGTEATANGVVAAAVRLKTGFKVRDVALGHAHTCVLGADKSIYCFGSNDAGQLGAGRPDAVGDHAATMGDAMQPVALGAGFRAKTIASGDRHACALSDDGRVKCWGAAESGQLGLGDTKNRGAAAGDMGDALPAVNLGQGQFAVELDCGARHCCARTVQNTMKCWGDNTNGQLGLGDVTPRGNDPSSTGDNLPFVLTPPLERVLSIQLDGDRTCARTDSGLRCWGRNRSGELGYGDREVRGGTLTTVPRLLTPLGI